MFQTTFSVPRRHGVYLIKHMRLWNLIIGVAPSTQFTHIRNKNSNTQEDSPNVVEVIFHPSGNKFFPFIEVPISKSDVIVENHCLIQ